MDGQELQTICVFAAIALVLWLPGFAFKRVIKQPAYQALRDEGQPLHINTILKALPRPRTDPLRPAHIALGKIGLLYVFLQFIGVFGVTLIITGVFWLAGVR